MKVLFMGTPEFAVPCLEKLIEEGHDICGVFTRPDRPRGRGMSMTPPPVKEAALRHGIPVYQPLTFKGGEAGKIVEGLAPEVIVVVAYGRLLPESVLNIPPLGCINVHASLLPAYRGAAPMQWAIINGEKTTGITTMHMAKELDSGDMILQKAIDIGENENIGSLHDRMSALGAQLIAETLRLIAEGKAPRTVQDHSALTYAPMIDKAVCEIDFKKSAQQVHNLVRALSPSPCAFTFCRGNQLKIYETLLDGTRYDREPGTAVEVGDEIVVCCGDGKAVRIKTLQKQGGRRMNAAEYLRGHPIEVGDVFARPKPL